MRFLGLPSCLLLAGILFSLPAAAQHPNNHPKSPITPASVGPALVPLEVTPNGHLLVKAKINGVEGHFQLDTGAGMLVLTEKFAQRVPDLQRQDGRFTGFRATGDRLDLPLATARTLAVGGLVVSQLPLSVYPGELGGIDGLISLTAFCHQPFTLDYAHQTLVLETPASLARRRQGGRAVALQLHDTYGLSLDMATYCRINDKLTLLVELDSGSPTGQYWFNAAFAPQLGVDTARLGRANRTIFPSALVAHNRNVLYRTTLARIAPVAQPAIGLTNVPAGLMTGLIYDGIMPLKWLGDCLTIDLPHQVLFAQ